MTATTATMRIFDALSVTGDHILYGRDMEIGLVRKVYERATGTSEISQQQIVLIVGAPGTGKSALAHTLDPLVTNDGGLFITGSFDQTFSEPYVGLVSAFTEFAELILDKLPHRIDKIKEAFTRDVGCEGHLLTSIIPALTRILGSHEREENEVLKTYSSGGALHQFHFVFCQFIKAICDADCPIVMFLDDLQWADAASLELLRAICTQSQGTPLLMVGAFHPLSPNITLPLSSALANMARCWNTHVAITKISLENLSKAEVNILVSDTLGVSSQETTPLSQIVFQQTEGNTFYVLHLLWFLSDQGWLYIRDEKWDWDVQAIESALESQTVVSLMATKIRSRLNVEEQHALKVAACMGKEIDDKILAIVTDTISVTKCLKVAEGEVLLVFCRYVGRYRFVHDHVHDAALSLIPKEDCAAFQLEIGRKLWKGCDPQTLVTSIFVITKLIHTGISLLHDAQERYAVARLNLMAAERAVSMSAFPEAALYAHRGINLLGDDCWVAEYQLSLALYTCCAEVEVNDSNYQKAQEMIDTVLSHTTTLEDKMRCYRVLIMTMGQYDGMQEIETTALGLLKELGEPFPKAATKLAIAKDFIKTKLLLRGKTDEDLLSLPRMTDQNKLAIAQILVLANPYLYFARSRYTPLLSFRMVRLCVRYGMFPGAATALAGFGMVLCSLVGDVNEGCRFGRLAMTLLEREPGIRQWVPRICATYYGGVHHFMAPLRASLEPLQYASRVAMELGNKEYSTATAILYLYNAYHSGRSLVRLSEEISKYAREMLIYRQANFLLMLSPIQQLIQNASGRSPDPRILSGDALNREVILKEALDNGFGVLISSIYYCSVEVAYLFRDFKLVCDLCEQFFSLELVLTPLFGRIKLNFLYCLSIIALMRSMKKSNLPRRWHLRFVGKEIKYLGHHATRSPSNFLCKLKLLEAEHATLQNEKKGADRIKVLYDKAIGVASHEGIRQEAAFACERAGDHFDRIGDVATAHSYLKRAQQMYLEWGATAKAAQLRLELVAIELRTERKHSQS